MKLVFATVEAHAKVENLNPYKAQVECLDGNHPLTNKSVFRDRKRRLPSFVLVWQGIREPQGESSPTLIDSVLAETDYTKLHKQKPMVSKRWVRSLFLWLKVFGLFVLLVFAAVIAAFGVYVVLAVFA